MTVVFDLDRVLAYLAGELGADAGRSDRPDRRTRVPGGAEGVLDGLVPITAYHVASFTLEASVRLTRPLRSGASDLGPVRFVMEAPAGASGVSGVDDLLIRMDGRADGLVRISRWRSPLRGGRRDGGWSDDVVEDDG